LDSTNNPADGPHLFMHRHRPQWGAALLVRQGQQRVTYQFQDGRQRTFRREFAEMFEPIEEPAEGLVSNIRARNNATIRREKSPPVMSFAEQIQVFKSMFPGGFSDAEYLLAWRGQEGRPLKQHLDPDLVRAKELMSKSRMETFIKNGDFSKVVDDFIAVFSGSALIRPSRELQPLRDLEEGNYSTLADSLFILLHDEAPIQERIQQWVIALEQLGLPLTWAMVTVPGALFQPSIAIYIRERPLAEQSRIVGKGGPPGRLPSPTGYMRAHTTIAATLDRLKEAEMKPVDLLDVYVFIWETLRPRGRAALAALKAA
jgi:hypothetical protein